MKFILGTKEGMTQVYDANGVCHPATILRVTPATITQVKTDEKDGYTAVQVASGAQKEHRVGKAQKGHAGGAFRTTKEFRPRKSYDESVAAFEKGQTINASTFAVGDNVVVSAISKGKGFQGVVKRHGFAGGRGSHGNKHALREPGSIGGGGRAGGRVIKGMRMAGRMGGDRISVKNLQVLQVNADENVLLIKGAIPGRKGTVVEVRNV
jgi:large subunit ribosomal protein L3